ncbi:acyl-CoA dehydrogenase family protein [Bartonella sp. LJL80]
MLSPQAPVPRIDCEPISFLLRCSDEWENVQKLDPAFAETAAMHDTLLKEAARFAEGILAPLNQPMDVEGARLVEGKVLTTTGHKTAWKQFCDAGWTLLGQPEIFGGQEAPLALWAAVQGIFDRSCPAFGMLPVPQISAAKLISHWGDECTCEAWLPNLIQGKWGATICISEADAGSDVARMRTKAEKQTDGRWLIQGEKCWISYGHHDLTDRIGHCLLAKAYDEEGEPCGISLFLVPNQFTETPEKQQSGNGVVIQRVEEKMGLHGSPTCSIAFDKSEAVLLGQAGRGLAQMFVMIANMRLSVAVMGGGIASAAYDTALNYSLVRKQGGDAHFPPVPIHHHMDVRRMLRETACSVDLLRGLIFSVANHTDLSLKSQDKKTQQDSQLLTQFLLPVLKTIGAETGFHAASTAMQILGGAGYTSEWPIEQGLRDSRVLAIFEGTSGIQALDLLHRRLHGRDQSKGLHIFLNKGRSLTHGLPKDLAENYRAVFDLLELTAQKIIAMAARDAEAGADAFLHLVAIAALSWIAARILQAHDAPTDTVLNARFFLEEILIRAQSLSALALLGSARLQDRVE